MMQNRTTKALFGLIKRMNKWEKKCFNHYARRNPNSERGNALRLYQALNSMDHWDEKLFSLKVKAIQQRQLPGLTVKLYSQILDSLRTGKKDENVVMQLHHLMDHVHILYSKGFWVQALKVLRRLKKQAQFYHQVPFLFQALTLQREIQLVYGCSSEEIETLNGEIKECTRQLSLIGHCSSQSMLLYGWYKRWGLLRNGEEEKNAEEIYQACLGVEEEELSFYPQLYRLQATTYYRLLKKHTRGAYTAAGEWVALFHRYPEMKEAEPVQYLRGLYYLNEAAYQQGLGEEVVHTANRLKSSPEAFYQLSAALNHCLSKKYVDAHVLEEAYRFVQSVHHGARLYEVCYKASLLCFAGGQYERAIDFTLIALNRKADFRMDLQYQLRRLHLQAHQKMGNLDLTDYLELATHRFGRVRNLIHSCECSHSIVPEY